MTDEVVKVLGIELDDISVKLEAYRKFIAKLPGADSKQLALLNSRSAEALGSIMALNREVERLHGRGPG